MCKLEKALQIVTVKARPFLTPNTQINLIISIGYVDIDIVGTEDAILLQQRGKNFNTFFKGGIQPCLNLKRHLTD
jgi:hypothetical protein